MLFQNKRKMTVSGVNVNKKTTQFLKNPAKDFDHIWPCIWIWPIPAIQKLKPEK